MPPRRTELAAAVSGSVLVAASFVLGLPFLYWNTFVDEGDSFAVATLLLRGRTLYRDVFSHHFPFVYDWLAWSGLTAGPSVGVYRLSVLGFQTMAFGLALALSRHRLAVGLTAVLWRLLAPFYYGNMAVHPVFSAAFLFPLTVLGLSWAEKEARTPRGGLLLGGIAGLAFWNDPLTLLVSGAVFFALFLRSRRAGAHGVLAFLFVLLAGSMRLVGSGASSEFWDDAVRFNAEVYARYVWVVSSPWERALGTAASGLGLVDAQWWHTHWVPLRFPDRAWFTGGFFRVAVLGLLVAMLLERRFFAAVWIYAVAVLELSLFGNERFRASPFVLLALYSASRLAVGGVSVFRGPGRHVLRMFFAFLLGWLATASAMQLFSLRSRLDYESNFGRYERRAAWLRPLACLPGTRLGWYPSDPYVYFFTGLEPLGGYPFLFPWVAEVAMDDVIREAGKGRAILYLDLRGEVWGHGSREFLGDLHRFAGEHYRELRPGLFVSRDLARACLGSGRTEAGKR
ncbi:MAG: hypothetical protein KatS3mg076_0204 [Candidatus Binatia bacterium]|nr:MAG: hypothetical protein KatS3mg076_0204 [Candidatus Binatia bacterium]